MKINSIQLYVRMQEEIDQLKKLSMAEMLLIERSFSIATRYWYKIETILESYSFKYENDEIKFFKHIKPMFTGVIEYYTFRYQAILFKPSSNKTQVSLYWINELKRIERFYHSHREFYNYYLGGHTDKDNIYFIRKYSHSKSKNEINFSPDHIAARILGYQEYSKYIETELTMLMQGNNKRSDLPTHFNSCNKDQFHLPPPKIAINI